MKTILTLEGISKKFGVVNALSDIDLSVASGEIHALLGENGAGKSTLMKILSGIHRPDRGRIVIDDQERRFDGYNDAIAAGIAIIFQEFNLIPYLNAVENIFLGREMTNRFGLLSKTAMKRKAQDIFGQLEIEIDLQLEVSQLSSAQQQFVEIGKALLLDARILILDEPTATLTPNEAEHLFKIMRELRQRGVAMIFISHHMDEIFQVCDRITVLRDGANAGAALTGEVTEAELVEMMVGRKLEHSFPPKPSATVATVGKAVLEVEAIQLSCQGPLNRFDLRAGEILGFAGLVGSGRTELVLAVIGASPSYRKEVKVNGVAARLRDTADALALGIGLLPESRKTEGLILDFSVKDNISINNLGKYTGATGWLNRKAELATSNEMIRKVGVKTPDALARVGNLSGGNQQKVVLARWLNHHCKILIFDEPTRGIDVGAKAEIYGLMRELTASGYAIIMISSELPEIVGMCDRVAVFRQGAIVTILEEHEINANEVMRHATTSPKPAHV
ncbi:MAG: sugar ABC transporter ATP-binding protein [Collimonas pratensis]|uniref:sugar ABC transporter ATP-binding protein n=1 Tax=Collimonas pratensis TaxID=279113 RepID=UPI003C715FC6